MEESRFRGAAAAAVAAAAAHATTGSRPVWRTLLSGSAALPWNNVVYMKRRPDSEVSDGEEKKNADDVEIACPAYYGKRGVRNEHFSLSDEVEKRKITAKATPRRNTQEVIVQKQVDCDVFPSPDKLDKEKFRSRAGGDGDGEQELLVQTLEKANGVGEDGMAVLSATPASNATSSKGRRENSADGPSASGERSCVKEVGQGVLVPHMCRMCPSTFAHQHEITDHMQAVQGRLQLYTCVMCYAAFEKRFHFSAHVLEVHESHKCSACPSIFKNFGRLKKHLLTDHKGLRLYGCRECTGVFVRSSEFQTHVRNFHGNRLGHMDKFCAKEVAKKALTAPAKRKERPKPERPKPERPISEAPIFSVAYFRESAATQSAEGPHEVDVRDMSTGGVSAPESCAAAEDTIPDQDCCWLDVGSCGSEGSERGRREVAVGRSEAAVLMEEDCAVTTLDMMPAKRRKRLNSGLLSLPEK
mmetsp:Transcript_8113/g.21254  ORF Transcript_8113/g.21254 Transcript_8113/m.21254 type:complete len:470 (+) Transcript_8113:3553-4962(+)